MTQPTNGENQPTAPALACQLGALDAARRQRQGEVLYHLGQLVLSVEELSDGYGLELPANDRALSLAAEFIATERLCCPFFNFNLDVPAHGRPITLRLSGSLEVKDFLRAQLMHDAGLNRLRNN